MAINTPFLESTQLFLSEESSVLSAELVPPRGEAYHLLLSVPYNSGTAPYGTTGVINILKNGVIVIDNEFTIDQTSKASWLDSKRLDGYIISPDQNLDHIIRSGEIYELKLIFSDGAPEDFGVWLAYTQTLKDKFFLWLRQTNANGKKGAVNNSQGY
ncbi:MAG: hypothetical protein IAE97_12080 [Chthoniobacterales bacterium]|nr:hypothetical protein [Chthoniobacterales bacterium]